MSQMKPLLNQHALVTGGSKGLGKAIAEKISSLGGRVTILSRNEEVLRATTAELNAKYPLPQGRHDYISFDLKKPEEIEAFFSPRRGGSRSLLRGVNILVNCAGVSQAQLLLSTSTAEIQDIINVNLVSPVVLSKLFVRQQARGATPQACGRHRRDAHIVNVSSVLSETGHDVAGTSVYTASKGGLSRFGACLDREMHDVHRRRPARPRVRVHTLEPGLLPETDIGKSVAVDRFEAATTDAGPATASPVPVSTTAEVAQQVAQLLLGPERQ